MAARKAGDTDKIKQLGMDLAKELKAVSSALSEKIKGAGTSADKDILNLKISIIKGLADDLETYCLHGRGCPFVSAPAAARKKAH